MDARTMLIHTSADFVASKIGGKQPSVGIVLGSGLGKLADIIQDPVVVPYKDIPGFPVSTAVGHKGNFIIGELGGKTVICMQGRFHFYEGYEMEQVTLPIRVMKLLGVQTLLVSNAAGAANPEYKVGDIMIIKDHISAHRNPLIGPNFEEFGPRFPDMTCAYDLELIAQAESIAAGMGLTIKKGVYYSSTGPTYETPAEVRFYRMIGADALGMSTVPEVIVARHCGIRVFGVSVITNCCNTDNIARNLNDADDVVLQADRAADNMTQLFTNLISTL